MNGSERIAQRLAAQQARVPGDRDERDADRRSVQADAEADRNGHREDQRREGEDRVHHAHRYAVADAADGAGEQPDQARRSARPATVTMLATSSEIRAPSAKRANTSRPSWSVPIGCVVEGLFSELIRSCALGPYFHRIGAKIANSTSSTITPSGMASGGQRGSRARHDARDRRMPPPDGSIGPCGCSAGASPAARVERPRAHALDPSSCSICKSCVRYITGAAERQIVCDGSKGSRLWFDHVMQDWPSS